MKEEEIAKLTTEEAYKCMQSDGWQRKINERNRQEKARQEE